MCERIKGQISFFDGVEKNKMKMLIACEESQEVCKAFRARGHEVYSCDLQPCSGGHPEWHIMEDVRDVINGGCKFTTMDGVLHEITEWDMIIAHPPCTRLCNSGLRWLYYGDDNYRAKKRKEQDEAIQFFLTFTNIKCKKVVIENPVGIMSRVYRKPDQIYNPYDFKGETECKATCLWIKGVPPLSPNQKIAKDQRTHGIWKAEFKGRKYSWSDPEVSKLRSKTPTGVAEAMAEQWG